MFKKILMSLFVLMTVSTSVNAYVTSNPYDSNIREKCKDGTYTTSVGSGRCSGHGGAY